MMPTAFNEKEHADCAEAEQLIDRWGARGEDESMDRAYQLLVPLVEKQMPAAMYLYACYLVSRECANEEDAERRYIELIQAAAHAGHAAAQFRLGQELDRGGDLLPHDAEQSANWFRLAAEQGDPYAQWVHGLNLLSGLGIPKDEALGLQFIERAAVGKFGGALEFLADAYLVGAHGYPKDESKSQLLRKRLQDPDVIGF
jgi:TPR repeat protein